MCILNIDQQDNEFNSQFTGPQNPPVQMWSIPYLSKPQQMPLRTNFAGSDILYLSCAPSVLEERIWHSFSHHICHHLALTSSWLVCVCVLPSGHRLPFFVELVALHCWQDYVILVHWKNSKASFQSVRIRSALFFLNLEKIKVSLRGSFIKFSKIQNFLNHFKSLQLDPAAND